MANNTITIKIDVDAKAAHNAVDNIKDSLEELNDFGSSIDTQDWLKVDELSKAVDAASTAINTLVSSMRSLNSTNTNIDTSGLTAIIDKLEQDANSSAQSIRQSINAISSAMMGISSVTESDINNDIERQLDALNASVYESQRAMASLWDSASDTSSANQAITTVDNNLDDLIAQLNRASNADLTTPAESAERSFEEAKNAVSKYQLALQAAEATKGTEDEEKAAEASVKAYKEAQKAVSNYEAAKKREVQEGKKLDNEAIKSAEDRVKNIVDGYNDQIDAIKGSMQKLSNATNSLKNIALGTLAIAGVESATGGINSIIKSSLEYASSVVENENLIAAVYDTSVDDIIDWANNTVKYYGLTSRAAEKYVSITSAMLNNMGLDNSDTVKQLSMNYTQLIGDIASAFNSTAEEVYESMRSGISGHVVALQKYGLVLTEVNMDQFLVEKGIDQKFSSLDAKSKQLARFAFIMEHTKDIQGDFARTSDSFANQTRMLSNAWEEFLVVLGKYAIPIIKPVIHILQVGLSYLSAVITALAELFGLEADSSSTFKNLTNASDYLLADTIETTEAQQEGTEAQEDTTKAVKETNKALKAGVKLLDLYTLDFSDNASTASKKEKTSIPLDELSSKLDLSDLKYDVPPIDLGIEVDQSKVDKIARDIHDFVVGLSNNNIVKLAIDIIKDFAENPIEHTIDLLIAGLSLKTSFKLGKEIFNKIYEGLSTENKAKLSSILGKAKSIGLGIVGIMESAIGGYNIGQSIYQQLHGEEVNIIDLVTGITTEISGIFMTTAAGFQVGGPIGAAIGFGISLITSAYTAALAYEEELKKAAIEATTEFATTGESFDVLTSKFTTAFNSEEAKAALKPVQEQFDSVKETSRSLVEVELPNLYNKLQESPEDSETAAAIDSTFSSLKENILKSTEALNNVKLDNLEQVLLGIEGSLGLSAQEISNITENIKIFYDTIDEKNADYYEKLKRAQYAGSELSSGELDFIKKYEAAYMGIQSVADSAGDTLNNIASGGWDLSTYNTAVEEFNGTVNDTLASLNSLREEAITKLDLAKQAGASEEDIAYLEGIVTFYESEYDKFIGIANTKAAELQSRFLEKIKQTFIVSIEEAGVLDTEKLAKTWFSDMDEAERQLVIDLSSQTFEKIQTGELDVEIPLSFITKFGDSEGIDTTTEDGVNKVKAIMYTLYSAMYNTDETIDFSMPGIITLDTTLGINLGKGNAAVLDDTPEFTSRLSDTVIGGLSGAGLKAYKDKDNNVVIDYATPIKLEPKFNVSEEAANNATEALTKPITSAKDSEEVKSAATTTGTAIADEAVSGIEAEISSEDTKKAVEDSTAKMLEDVSTAEEASQKGTEIADALTSSITKAIENATANGSAFMTAVDKIRGALTNVGTSLDTSMKSAINNVATYMNSLYKNIQSEVGSLGINDDLTISGLASIIKSKSFKIPMLADGAVIPANNPFLAVLGDQRSGTNIEAPVSLIEKTVREASGEQEVTVNATIYIGNEQIKDFVIDTVTERDLSIG